MIAPGTSYQELARNRLDGGFMATPAAVGSALLVRTRTHLYRIELPGAAASAAPAAGAVSQAGVAAPAQ